MYHWRSLVCILVIFSFKSKELENEAELRETTGAAFDLIAYKDSYRQFIPHYSPTIFGVGNEKIYFVLPGIPGEKEYLEEFLIVFYNHILPFLNPPSYYLFL